MHTPTNEKTVLIADDSWVIRQYLSKLLITNTNYEVIEAVDGIDALEKIETNQPDCILLDLLMPNLNGDDVLETMRKQQIDTPTIIITADIQETTKAKCIKLGAFDFINKPPNEKELLEVVELALKFKVKQ